MKIIFTHHYGDAAGNAVQVESVLYALAEMYVEAGGSFSHNTAARSMFSIAQSRSARSVDLIRGLLGHASFGFEQYESNSSRVYQEGDMRDHRSEIVRVIANQINLAVAQGEHRTAIVVVEPQYRRMIPEACSIAGIQCARSSMCNLRGGFVEPNSRIVLALDTMDSESKGIVERYRTEGETLASLLGRLRNRPVTGATMIRG